MEKIVIGLSGGVDSSVAAYLLKEQGYDVIGVTMQVWREREKVEKQGYQGISAVEDARRVASELGIPHIVMDFQDVFEKKVVEYFLQEYECGRTPNPCVMCNRHVKWQALYEQAKKLGAKRLATGHYAKIRQLKNGRFTLQKSAADAKDQTYALCQLTQEQLSNTLMPLGDYTKDQIREIADRIGLTIANKPDSQEICFIPDNDYGSFLEKRGGNQKGAGSFVSEDGMVLGEHKGIVHYTIGQRKGLGLSFGKPVFVTELRPETNQVVLGDGDAVYGQSLFADQMNFMSIPKLEEERRVTAKIRYSHKGDEAVVEMLKDGRLLCRFEKPVRAITPGQALVLYENDMVLGGGIILGKAD